MSFYDFHVLCMVVNPGRFFHPSRAKKTFLASILHDLSKNSLLASILQNNGILLRFLQVTFLAKSFQTIHFLRVSFREYISYKVFTRMLQDVCYLKKSCKKCIFLNWEKSRRSNVFSHNEKLAPSLQLPKCDFD